MVVPPRYALRFLRWFCREDYIDELEGDLLEVFQKEVKKSPVRAKWNFAITVALYFRPAFIKSFKPGNSTLINLHMFQHYMTIALRSFQRSKSSFIINVVGLSSGLACALLIYLWVSDEVNIDHFNKKDKQLYQVLQNYPTSAGIQTGAFTPGVLAAALDQEMPEVEYSATVIPPQWFSEQCAVSYDDSHLKVRPQFVSKDYFQIFDAVVLEGNSANPFPDMNSVMISDELAYKLFHTNEDVIGKIIKVGQYEFTGDYHIAGVFQKLPSNVSEPFDILFSFDKFVDKREGMLQWYNSDPNTYLLLQQGTDVASFNNKIAGFMKKKDPNSTSTLFIQRFSDRYLHGTYVNGIPSGGRIIYIQILSLVGAFILIIACINFMNLSTARATRRIKEVGVKKSVGASRLALIYQYLSESALITFVALVFAVLLVWLILPQFNLIMEKNLSLTINADFALSITAVLVITSLLAGSYPALYLSGFNPAIVLKGKLSSSLVEIFVRKGLVIFQFTVSVILIVGVLVVYRQTEYIQNKNLGYKKDNVVVLKMEQTPLEKLASFKTEIERVPGVISAGSFSHNLSGDHGNIELDWDGKQPGQKMDFANLEIGNGFIETMEIQFAEGRSFSPTEKSKNEIILNETAIKFMGLKDPIGKTIRFWGYEREIVGVAKDFNFESLHQTVKPCFFQVYPVMFNWVIRVEGGKERQVLARIESVHRKFSEGHPFEYSFLDESYQRLYASEQRVSVLSRYFTVLAIVISCLGLFALAAFTAEKRLKEIGIRKALGSSEAGIVLLLSSDFTKIVLISIALALPVSYLMTSMWLSSFAFRIALAWYYFAGAGLAALLMAWITIGANTIRAAHVNPAKCLRVE